MTARMTSMRRFSPLFRNLVRREVRQRYRGSALGLLWTLITPAIMVGAYTLVFKFLLGITIPNYSLFLVLGLTVWTFFFGGAQMAASSLVNNASLVTKVSFPRQIIPLAAMTGNAFTAGAMLAVALPLCLIFSEGSWAPLLVAPLLIGLLGVFTIGVGLLLASVNVYFRDVEHILAAIGLPWIFVTPIFYSFSTNTALTDHAWAGHVLHWANPIAPYVIALQDALFWGEWPTAGDLLYCVAAAAAMLAIGAMVFRRLEPEMAIEL